LQTECPELDADEWARAKAETMLELLAWLDEEFGSLEAYLDLIAFSASWRQRLRQAFRRPLVPSLDYV